MGTMYHFRDEMTNVIFEPAQPVIQARVMNSPTLCFFTLYASVDLPCSGTQSKLGGDPKKTLPARGSSLQLDDIKSAFMACIASSMVISDPFSITLSLARFHNVSCRAMLMKS